MKRWWCGLTHSRVMYGGGDTYECRTCGEVWAAPWTNRGRALRPGVEASAGREKRRRSLWWFVPLFAAVDVAIFWWVAR